MRPNCSQSPLKPCRSGATGDTKCHPPQKNNLWFLLNSGLLGTQNRQLDRSQTERIPRRSGLSGSWLEVTNRVTYSPQPGSGAYTPIPTTFSHRPKTTVRLLLVSSLPTLDTCRLSLHGCRHFSSPVVGFTTGIFSTWRAAGITCEHELFVTSLSLLSLSALFILAGWYHHHVAVPVATWLTMSIRS